MATVIYYWDDYDSSDWAEAESMVDGDEETYAETDMIEGEQLNSTNTCPGDDLGTITKVEIRAKGYAEESSIMILQPYIAALRGDEYEWSVTDTPAWSEWFDITTDTQAPSPPWIWDDIVALWLFVISGPPLVLFDFYYCSKTEVRVTYTPPVVRVPKPTVAVGNPLIF